MGNFEKLSVLVIVVIIVMILVVALYTWSDNPGDEPPAARESAGNETDDSNRDEGRRLLIDEWENEFRTGGDAKESEEPPTPVPTPTPDPEPVPQPDPDPEPAPAPEPKDEPAPAQEEWMYTVKKGDTLTEIAERELGTWKRYREILKLNPGVKAETIREGDTLKMPPRVTASSLKETAGGKTPAATPAAKGGSIPTGEWYVIRRGDRLERISKRAYGTFDRWPELWARNLSVIDDPDDPPVGAKIFIPK